MELVTSLVHMYAKNRNWGARQTFDRMREIEYYYFHLMRFFFVNVFAREILNVILREILIKV